MIDGNIPTLTINARTLPEAWERTVMQVYKHGVEIKTQYDSPDDPASLDATVIVTVEKPFAEPRIHKNMPGGPTELESYRQEVVDGIHNHWIDPENGKWTYTYNERLFHYCPCENLKDSKSPKPFVPVDQIQFIIDSLVETGYSRRSQAITYQPTCDAKTIDPPCLQRVWCRMLEDSEGNPVLNMNTHWRSRDLYRAWFMNAYALTDLQKYIAEEISKKISKKVLIGRYVDISDSLHLYGSLLKAVVPEIIKMKETDISISSRTYNSFNPAFKSMTDEAKHHLCMNPDYYANGDI